MDQLAYDLITNTGIILLAIGFPCFMLAFDKIARGKNSTPSNLYKYSPYDDEDK